ncbi:MAG: L-rhamnose isomerase [Defluviitaleaceae bacterium]|nr:L-rhamnose isomerase [Defluviitaleaceae bacterium]
MGLEKAYGHAKERFAKWGVDTDKAMAAVKNFTLSLHCWQGDDVTGFEDFAEMAGGGTLVTGGYPGRARTPEELRADLELVMSMIPGKQKVSLHAKYAETSGKKVGRNELQPEHFANWVDWAKDLGIGLDFNPTFFAHPMFKDGFSIASADEGVRRYWIDHGKSSRKIAEHFGKTLGKTCVTNFWMADGYKDIPIDRVAPRQRMKDALDEIFSEKIDRAYNRDAVESKLFGIGVESYTVGSNEFFMGYTSQNKEILLCMDAGHYHPSEVISEKISSALLFVSEVLLHVSRPVRWDSDHVVVYDDELKSIAQEIVRGGFADRVHFGLDYFDASINRVAAWTIGARNAVKAMLAAYLEPVDVLKKAENEGDWTSRLALLEIFKDLPYGVVWDYFCSLNGVPVREEWLAKAKDYERDVLSKRK